MQRGPRGLDLNLLTFNPILQCVSGNFNKNSPILAKTVSDGQKFTFFSESCGLVVGTAHDRKVVCSNPVTGIY